MKNSRPLPVLFIGHGSPMNAIDSNAYTKMLVKLAEQIEKPRAILCISAHWMTEGTYITHMDHPKTIHDFGGFPQALFDVQYPAPGDPDIAVEIQKEISSTSVRLDSEAWGLDHGTWSVLRHMYPKADTPVMQLSMDMSQNFAYHVRLGSELASLREKGVLIIGSGNVVHNLRRIKWEPGAEAYDWALEFDQWFNEKLMKRDFQALQNDVLTTEAGKLSVPTTEHYIPLLYILGAAKPEDGLKIEFEEMQNGSISMRSFSFGRV